MNTIKGKELADIIPLTARSQWQEGRQEVCMTYSELLEFSQAIISQVALQATVELLTDKQIDTLISRHGCGGWQMMSDMRGFARAVLASAIHPASKATDKWNPDAGDNFGSAEHWKEKAHDWAAYAEKLRKEIGGMVSASEFAKVNEALEKWISGVYVRHVKPVQSSSIPEATAYAESMHYAVTKQWIGGWNDCRGYRLSTNKPDTSEAIRNAALEEAADLCNEMGSNWTGEVAISSGYLADSIRDLKSATPSIIKVEPTGGPQ